MVNFEIEKEYISDGFNCICGIDEAGRGPLAGPVCAAAVILPVGAVIPGLDDSKKLTEKKRCARKHSATVIWRVHQIQP